MKKIGWALVCCALVLIGAATVSAVKRSSDPLIADGFQVVTLEVDGVVMGTFDTFSGMECETDVIEFQDGDDPLMLKRPGRVRYRNIVLTRSQLVPDAMWDWYQSVVTGTVQRKNGTVIIGDRDGRELVRYHFYNAWPCAFKCVALNGGKTTGEEITLAVDRIERRRPAGSVGATPVQRPSK
ncbi:hypothetical protein JCM14469_37500 [Desulfatiferula olefinivorans]